MCDPECAVGLVYESAFTLCGGWYADHTQHFVFKEGRKTFNFCYAPARFTTSVAKCSSQPPAGPKSRNVWVSASNLSASLWPPPHRCMMDSIPLKLIRSGLGAFAAAGRRKKWSWLTTNMTGGYGKGRGDKRSWNTNRRTEWRRWSICIAVAVTQSAFPGGWG